MSTAGSFSISLPNAQDRTALPCMQPCMCHVRGCPGLGSPACSPPCAPALDSLLPATSFPPFTFLSQDIEGDMCPHSVGTVTRTVRPAPASATALACWSMTAGTACCRSRWGGHMKRRAGGKGLGCFGAGLGRTEAAGPLWRSQCWLQQGAAWAGGRPRDHNRRPVEPSF